MLYHPLRFTRCCSSLGTTEAGQNNMFFVTATNGVPTDPLKFKITRGVQQQEPQQEQEQQEQQQRAVQHQRASRGLA